MRVSRGVVDLRPRGSRNRSGVRPWRERHISVLTVQDYLRCAASSLSLKAVRADSLDSGERKCRTYSTQCRTHRDTRVIIRGQAVGDASAGRVYDRACEFAADVDGPTTAGHLQPRAVRNIDR